MNSHFSASLLADGQRAALVMMRSSLPGLTVRCGVPETLSWPCRQLSGEVQGIDGVLAQLFPGMT